MHPTKLSQENIKVHSQNAYSWGLSRDIARTMPKVANTTGMVLVKVTHRIHKQVAKLFCQAFTLLPIGYTQPGLNSIALYSRPLKSSLSVLFKSLREYKVNVRLLRP